ncbi:hypothetical protein IK110_00070 [Candidatus Saccharibacteria bacterium]|nr:hypothetical protein [Candidatus Saccharibacteria bacterium]
MIKLFTSEDILGTPDFLKPINDIVTNLGFQYEGSITDLGISVEYNWRDDREPQVKRCGSFESGSRKDPDGKSLSFVQFPIVFLQKQYLGPEGLGLKTDHFYSAEFEIRYRQIRYDPTCLTDNSTTNVTDLILKLKDRIERHFAASSQYVCLTDLADYPEIRSVFHSWDY